jgi:hypothetical protein
MGYKCPNCKEGFELDKEALYEHLREFRECAIKAIDIFSERLRDTTTDMMNLGRQEKILKGERDV